MFRMVQKGWNGVSVVMSLTQFAMSRYRQICANSGDCVKVLTLSRLIRGANFSFYRCGGFPNKQNREILAKNVSVGQ